MPQSEIERRISNIEGIQHFQMAMIGALAKVCSKHLEFATTVRENLQRQQAALAGESVDERRLEAFESLMNEILSAQQ